MARLEREERPATHVERETLAAWSSWGAVPEIFDETRAEWAQGREQLHELLGEQGYVAARRTTINAHYTHPAIARAMWALAAELGFEGGRVLEPGCGAGVFIGLAPVGAEMTGVELDVTTAAIAQQHHPDARIISRSFAQYQPRGTFDLTVGNVPFADVRLYDPVHNRQQHSIHNHFIVKSLALTRPGGLVIVLSSRYTLDAGNPAARREMSELADLLGAVRLPTGAHRRAAGTDALTDLLILRRRPDGTEPLSDSWINTHTVQLQDGEARINEHFLEHPDRVLGELTVGQGMYGADTLSVVGELDAETIAAAIALHGRRIAAAAPTPPSTSDRGTATGVDVEQRLVEAPEGLWDGHLIARADGGFAEVKDGLERPVETPRTIAAELRALLGLRDRARELLAAEAQTLEDIPAITQSRSRLRADYDSYYARYGPINRFDLRRTGRIDPESGEERMARIAPRAITAFRGDPFCPLVMSLEAFDETTQRATPATLLSKRVIAPREPVLGVETAQDALTICLDTHGHVEIDEIARLLGRAAEDARRELGELVYEDPQDARLIPAAEYLSGNVRAKLEHARARAEHNPRLGVNVASLERVLPVDLGADEVEPRLGAAWIGVEDHRAFLAEILQDPSVRVEHPGGMVWAVRANNSSVLARSEWGTSRIAAGEIAKAVLEQRPVQVTDELDDGRRVINPVESAAAQDKASAMQERFVDWCWQDPERARRLLGEYNRRFNSIVLRDYGLEGERLSLPGLSRTFQPRDHQRAAVARMLCEPAVGLFHQVGAGKTAEMIIGVTELRRLGMVRKPCLVVPNHMLEQFSREYLQLYPQARVLAASSQDLAGEKRRRFVARAASNDWDAVLMTRSAFERIPVTPETQARYIEKELHDARAMLANAQAAGGLTVKRVEKMVLSREQDLTRLLDSEKDPGISFEDTGIDYLACDEGHSYKNLRTISNIPGAAIEGSKRASDLHVKTRYLRDRHGARVITIATATPIANSVTEAHVMQRYLRPDLLADAGVEHFDAWAATFGQTVTAIEMAPTGGGNYRVATRFARYNNVPEMLRMFHVFADVKTAEDLDLPTPQLAVRADGQRAPETVVIPASPEITSYVAELGQRAEQVRARAVLPEDDNMLKITGDGRKAALDMRLATGQPATGACKLDIAAGRIAGIWREYRDQPYNDPDTGERSPTPGALQIVFCDLGTPRDGWNAYDELRNQLADLGVPRHQIRYIHEAKNDAEKGRLFAAARAGHISVLIGSTEKMGVGVNVQARAVAMHLLDCPWRPADQEQREGRIKRQGNQNPEVQIFRYVVEGSFDAYSWQTVERKARFINQIMRGRLDAREIEDIGDNALSFAEVKALASGDPLILAKAHADAEVTRLSRLERAWQRNHQTLRSTIAAASAHAEIRERAIAAVTDALARRTDTRGERFAITINGTTLRERKPAGEQLNRWAQAAQPGSTERLAQLGGLHILGMVSPDYRAGGRELVLTLEGLAVEPARAPLDHAEENPLTLIRQLEHRVTTLDQRAERLRAERQDAILEGQRAREALDRPFKYGEELQAARAALVSIIEQMQAAAAAPEPAADDSTVAAPASRDVSRVEHAAHETPLGPARQGRVGRHQARPARPPLLPPPPPPPDVYSYPPPGGIEI
ncbi:MAG: helicase-related protein [Solirubrobacteraceae bacterium]